MIEAVIFVVMVGVVVLVVVLSAFLYLYCGSASNKSLKHKVFGCFLVHFLPGSGCIGVGGVDGGVVLVVVVVVVVRVVVEVVACYLFFLICGNALDNFERPGVFGFILLSILSV